MKQVAMTALMLLTWAMVASPIRAQETATTDEIREKIAAIGVRSVQSSTGHLIVSGPDPLGNAVLLSLAEEAAVAVEFMTGIPLSFERQSVRILVLPPSTSPRDEVVDIEHVYMTGLWVHRVVLANYAAMETEAAADALCASFLSVYLWSHATGSEKYALPVWLRRGAVRILTVDRRQATIEAALRLWRQGFLLPLANILESSDSAPVGERESVACGAFVLWFASLPERGGRFSDLFRRLSEGKRTDLQWVREWIPGSGDPDEQRDRWLLSQRLIVRGVGSLSLEHLDALAAEWFIDAGLLGIPRDAVFPEKADCTALAGYRDQPWFAVAVRERRHRIEMLAQGRPSRFQTVVAAYVETLNALEGGEPPSSVHGLAAEARRQWMSLRATVVDSGGVWSEP